ncbi:hypothetical protein NXV38_21740 [Bacteroides caccae]|nr:hypothetical protein [Bacteroides caccae]
MMQTMTIIYAPQEKYYLLKTGKFVNMESFIENIREETAGCPLIKFCTTSKRPDYLPKGRCRTHKTVYEEVWGDEIMEALSTVTKSIGRTPLRNSLNTG